MEDKPISPKRPHGPTIPARPSVAQDHGHAACERNNYAGSSRSSLFGLFKRQSSKSSLRPPKMSNQSARSTCQDSYFGAFDNISLGTSVGLESPQQAHEMGAKVDKMLTAAAKYRQAFEAMSVAAAEFGNTLYECAETKGAASGRTSLPDHSVNTDLQAAGGLHLLISNHANILASSLASQVETPVRRELEEFDRRIAAKELEFKTHLRSGMTALRDAELQRIKDARKRDRDLGSYRNSLLDITYQIDDINRLKMEFLGDLHTLGTELAEVVHSSMASTVTAEIEVFESVARKGWTGGGLDGLLAGCPDPFETSRSHVHSQKDGTGPRSTPQKHKSAKRADNEVGGSWTSSVEDYIPNHIGSSGSERSSAKSPNLFSIIPPGAILPADTNIDDDDDDDSSQERPALRGDHARTSSDISEIADLTLTPSRLNQEAENTPNTEEPPSIGAQ